MNSFFIEIGDKMPISHFLLTFCNEFLITPYIVMENSLLVNLILYLRRSLNEFF